MGIFHKSIRSSLVILLGVLIAGCSAHNSKSESPVAGEATPPNPLGPGVAMADAAAEMDSDQSENPGGLDDLEGLDDSFFEEEIEDPTPQEGGYSLSDPLEGFNRGMFAFNDWVYEYIMSPLSKGYTTIMPDPFEAGIDNFFSNLQFPVRFVNHALQGDLDDAGRETSRFLIDSTVGLLGLLQPSADLPELQNPDTDLGTTFGVWGIDHGAYLVLPILGPSSTRDFVGQIGDGFLNATNLFANNEDLQIGLNVLDFLNNSESLLNGYNRVVEGSLDPYIAMRDIYEKRRTQGVSSKRDRPLYRALF